jgi:hypothetical protein
LSGSRSTSPRTASSQALTALSGLRRVCLQRRLASIATHPELAAVYRLLGLKDPSWGDLYKALELLGDAVGGEQRLTKRTGVAHERIKLLKGNSNDPELTGDDARHAVPRRSPA